MKVIYKYMLTDVKFQKVALPKDAEILGVQEQFGDAYLYALVDAKQEPEPRKIECFTTGFPLDDKSRKYISTVQFSGGNYVLHYFEQL